MKQGPASAYYQLFLQTIGCILAKSEDAIRIGGTCMGEVDEFVDTFMQDWIVRYDNNVLAVSAPSSLYNLRPSHYRFCTFQEYEILFKPARQEHWNEPVFRLLGIDNEQKQNAFKRSHSPGRNGYFKLMETMNPQLWSFFFRGNAAGYSDGRTGKAYLHCWGNRLR